VIAGIALLGLAGWAIARALATDPPVAVPDVLTLSVEEATERLEAEGFDVDVEQRVAEDPTDEQIDTVVEQDPESGTEVPAGSEVTITVLVQPGQVLLPDVTGRQFDEAEEILTRAGFRVDRQNEASAAPSGEVIGQDPAGDSQQPPDTLVTLTVSAGGVVTVENVIGRTEDTARSTLEGQGLNVNVEYVADGSVVGAVVNQSPSGGSQANSGDTVTIQVTGVQVNWEVGESAQSLYNQLSGAGLDVKIEPEEGTDVIDSVDVQSGTVVKPGSSVTITVVPEDDNGGGGGGDCDPEEEDCDENGGFLPPGGNGYVAPTNTWARNE
jgi:serine/threonine-protein kinase